MKNTVAKRAIKNMILSAIIVLPLQLNTEILPKGDIGFASDSNTKTLAMEEKGCYNTEELRIVIEIKSGLASPLFSVQEVVICYVKTGDIRGEDGTPSRFHCGAVWCGNL